MLQSSDMQTSQNWVRESSFGTWFLGTDTWVKNVLRLAIEDLEKLFPEHKTTYPKILDVGCGFGHSLVLLDQHFKPEQLTGLDVDPEVTQRAADNAAQCRAKVDFLVCNAEHIEIPDNSFDMVFCHQTFHHIIRQEAAIKEFYRVLKPGGVLLFAESCRRFIHSLVIKVLFRHPMDVQKTAEEYVQLIRDTGFQLADAQISKPYLWWTRLDLGMLERLGIQPSTEREETLVNLVATKPPVA